MLAKRWLKRCLKRYVDRLKPTYDLKSVKFDWILLRNSPKINLEKVIKILKSKLIIADGSNYNSYVKRWQKTCTKKSIHFHDTFEDGAFIYDLNHQGLKEGLNAL